MRMQYALVDMWRSPAFDRALRNMADAVFRLQRVESLEPWRQEVAWWREWVQREALSVWTAQVLLPSRLPEASIPEARTLGQWGAVLDANRPWRTSSAVTLTSALVLPTPPSSEWRAAMHMDVRSRS